MDKKFSKETEKAIISGLLQRGQRYMDLMDRQAKEMIDRLVVLYPDLCRSLIHDVVYDVIYGKLDSITMFRNLEEDVE